MKKFILTLLIGLTFMSFGMAKDIKSKGKSKSDLLKLVENTKFVFKNKTDEFGKDTGNLGWAQ